MNEVVELLRAAIKKQSQRTNLTYQERKFIADVNVLLDVEDEQLFELDLIGNVRSKLNLLGEQLNSKNTWKGIIGVVLQQRCELLQDFIPVILECKIEIIKEVFEDINLEPVLKFIDAKKFAEANKLLAGIFITASEKIFTSQEELDQLSVICNKLFTDEDDPASAIVIAPPGTAASLHTR